MVNSTAKKIKIFCDFDGTITKNDISVALLKNFGKWGEGERSILKGNIGSKSAYLIVKESLKGEIEDMKRFVKEIAEIEEGFKDFFNLAKNSVSDFLIVSDGFDFYIQEILGEYGIETKFFASRLDKSENGFFFEFPNSSKFCDLCATCKLKILREEGKNSFTVFIGNGISDRCIIEEADIVFAKSRLQDICQMKGISFFPFENFNDIIYAFNLSPKCFVIDFDGTIGWSYEGILDAFSYTFRKLKIKMPPKEELTKLIGIPLEDCFKKLVGEKHKKAVKIFRERYKKIFLRKTQIAVGTKKVIEELRKMRYKTAILSNKKSYFLKKLVKHFGLKVDLVVGEGDIKQDGKIITKPDPKTIDFISEKLKVDKKDIFVIGDTGIDLLTAKEANFIALYSYHNQISYFKEKGKVLFFLSNIKDLLKLAEFYYILNS